MVPLTPPARLWLAGPTRFAGLTPNQARLIALLIALLIAASFTALGAAGPPPVSGDPAQRAEDQADVVLYEAIVAGLRRGDAYYPLVAGELRSGNYPLRPFVTFRLPTLAMAQAAVPPAVTIGALYLLAVAVAAAWAVRLRPAFNRTVPLLAALLLLAAGMAVFVRGSLAPFHDVWAGLLIALSLAVRSDRRWLGAVLLGLAAVAIRETAALYVALMAGAAWLTGGRREALAWAGVLGLLAIGIVLHAQAVAGVVTAADPASPGWTGMLGFGAFIKTMTLLTALATIPAWIAAPLIALALAGWAAWPGSTGLRVAATLAGYAALLSLFGRPDTFYWGMLVAPVLLMGLAFAPDALRELATAALDRPRGGVTSPAP